MMTYSWLDLWEQGSVKFEWNMVAFIQVNALENIRNMVAILVT